MQDQPIVPPPVEPSHSQPVDSPVRMPRRALDWTLRVWRIAGSAVAVGLALLIGWHVVNGTHGLSAWQQKRVEDRQLQKEIDELQQENARLRVRVVKLQSDPHAIEHEARQKLHYARQDEVIVTLPPETPKPTQPAGK